MFFAIFFQHILQLATVEGNGEGSLDVRTDYSIQRENQLHTCALELLRAALQSDWAFDQYRQGIK